MLMGFHASTVSIELIEPWFSNNLCYSISNYDSFSIGTSAANHQIHAKYFCCHIFGTLFSHGAARVQCSVWKYVAVQCSVRTEP